MHTRSRRTSARPDERGVALVEMSLVALFLAVLGMGMLEYSNVFGTTIDVSSATRDAVRAGAATKTTGVAPDSEIIASFLDRSELKASKIDRLVIYRAESAAGTVPSACTSSLPTASTKCNIFTSADLLTGTPQYAGWPLSQRVAGSDYIGVWVQLQYGKIASLVWTKDHFHDSAVMLIEPKSSSNGTVLNEGFTTNATEHDDVAVERYADCYNACNPYSNAPGNPSQKSS